MKIIFNKYLIIDNLWLFWTYVIAIILMILVTILWVKKELKTKK